MADDVRLDRGTLGAQVRPRVFEGTVARVHPLGDGLPYTSGPEHRDLAELLRIVEQLPGLPIVTYAAPNTENPLSHPVNLIASGVEYHEIGRVISARVTEDGRAVASIYIHDKGALEEIEDGTKELSLGYRCSLDMDRFQRNITLDHLSVVKRARCGAACALKTDAVDTACPCTLASFVPTASIPSMQVAELAVGMTITLDEKSKKILDQLDQLSTVPAEGNPCTCTNHAIVHTKDVNMDLETLTKNLEAALAEVATLTTEITDLKASVAKTDEVSELARNQAAADLKVANALADKLAAEIETIKADAKIKVDAAESARKDADLAAFHAAVDARVDLLADAVAVGIEDPKSKTDREIKSAIVKKVDEMDIEDKHTADYVDGMYAGAMKRHTKAATSVAEVRTLIVENNDAADKAVAADPYKTEAEIAAAAEAKRKNRWR